MGRRRDGLRTYVRASAFLWLAELTRPGNVPMGKACLERLQHDLPITKMRLAMADRAFHKACRCALNATGAKQDNLVHNLYKQTGDKRVVGQLLAALRQETH